MAIQGTSLARVTARPERGLIDDLPEIVVSGVSAGAEVRIDATETDASGRRWSSWAVFTADGSGIATTKAAAIAGTYSGADPAGIFWSMRPAAEGPVYRSSADRITTIVEASVDGASIGRQEVERLVAAEGVRRSDVDTAGIRGVLFEPAEASGPAVIAVQGSGGGVNESEAALLASRGLTALALSYFNYPGQPALLEEIPLEYFEIAARWLLEKLGRGGERCALIGQSRGGELVLLLAATFPKVFGPVVSTAPSSQIWGGLGEAKAAWTLDGKPTVYMDAQPERPFEQMPTPIALTPLFQRAMADEARVAETAIPIERADCPILLLSGADDAMWPSADFAERIVARLARGKYPQPYRHVSFPSAGHTLSGIPNVPIATHSIHPVAHLDFAYGGTVQSTAKARAEAWRLRLEFLRSKTLG